MKQKNGKEKAQFYKKWWFWGIVVVVLIGVFGGCQSDNMDLPDASTNVATTEIKEIPTTKPTETINEEVTVPSTEAPAETPANSSVETQPEETEEPTKQTEVPDITEGTAVPSTEPEEVMVWIPIHGGQKYHKTSTCSSMEDPEYVTLSEAEARGFTACKRCYR